MTEVRAEGGHIDYITFVPDGEPTLDAGLGREIDLVKQLGVPVAVMTNSSLLGREDVKGDLARADWVSVKVDSDRKSTWRRVDRPHLHLDLDTVLEGILAFASTGDPERDLLSITSVHPMRQDAVRKLLAQTGSGWWLVERLLEEGKLVEQVYGGRRFCLRKLGRPD